MYELGLAIFFVVKIEKYTGCLRRIQERDTQMTKHANKCPFCHGRVEKYTSLVKKQEDKSIWHCAGGQHVVHVFFVD